MAVEISLKELIESGAHFGHQSRRWNPKMEPYLYGIREGVHVFDLTITKEKLEDALKVLKNAAKEGKSILFLGTKKQAKEKTREVAEETNSFFVDERWLGGTFTNFEQIKKSTQKLIDLREKREKGEFSERTKKEIVLIDREIARLERFFGGIVEMQELPDLLVIVDTKREDAAVREAKMRDVETIGMVDSNGDPKMVDHPIPMNDDATRAVEYVLDLMKQAILEGKKASKSKSKGKSKKKSTKKNGKDKKKSGKKKSKKDTKSEKKEKESKTDKKKKKKKPKKKDKKSDSGKKSKKKPKKSSKSKKKTKNKK